MTLLEQIQNQIQHLPIEKQAELALIDKALRDISYNTSHYIKKPA